MTREGLDADGFHHFYHELKDGDFFRMGCAKVTAAELQAYEENIVSHTAAINAGRPHDRQIKWKYFQWLALLFTEVYLDRYFRDRAALLADLNQFVAAFNAKYDSYEPMTPYREEDLNKVCFQNATGSGKTLLMHVHLKQFWHYAKKAGKDGNINFPFLITPNDRLSKQHRDELAQSGITGVAYTKSAGGELGEFLYTLEIQKIKEEDGPESFAGVNKKCKVRIAAHTAILKFDRRVALRSAMPAAFLCRQCIPASLHRAATSVLQADSIMPDPM